MLSTTGRDDLVQETHGDGANVFMISQDPPSGW